MYLNVDVNKVLNSKLPKIDTLTESYNKAHAEQTPLNIINFMSEYKKSSKETILENMSSLYNINSDITFSYFNTVLETTDFSENKLNEIKTSLNSLRESLEDEDYINRLDESIIKIDSVIESNNNIDNIREDVLLNLAVDRIRQSCVFESYLENDLDVLVYNINSSPETISEYERIIRKIKTSKTSEYFSSFPMLLAKNTTMILNLRVRVTGDVLDLLTCMPVVIADKLSHAKLSQSVMKSYVKVYDKQIALMYDALKDNEPEQYQLYSTYVKRLADGKIQLMNSQKALKESSTEEDSVNESITEMAPDIVLYDEGVVEDFIAELEDSLADLIFDPGEEINESKLENFIRISKTLEAASKVQKGMIKAGHKAGSGTQKAVSKLKSNMTDAKRASLPMKKSIDPIYNLINSSVNKMKDMDKKERTERIISGEFRLKLTNYIKKGILGIVAVGAVSNAGGAAAAVGKAAIGVTVGHLAGVIIAAIGILAVVAYDKKVDKKHRQKILIDLKNELALVEEKIDDAKSDGERDKKYQLMRIQQKLKKDIERIEYNLD